MFTPPTKYIQEYRVWARFWGAADRSNLSQGFISATGAKPSRKSTINYFTPSTTQSSRSCWSVQRMPPWRWAKSNVEVTNPVALLNFIQTCSHDTLNGWHRGIHVPDVLSMQYAAPCWSGWWVMIKFEVDLSRIPPCRDNLIPHIGCAKHRLAIYKRADKSILAP